MNSEIQVTLTGDAADLQETLDSTSDSLDTLGKSADDASAQVAGSADSTDAATGSFAALGDSAGVASDRLDVAGASADAAAGETDAAGAAAGEASGGFDLLSGSMLKSLAPLAALFLGYEGIKAVFEDAKQQTEQWEDANAQITNALKNTNGAIGLNVTQIDKLAEATAKGTTFTKAANLTVAAQFVALSGVNKTTLPQAITLTDDLATKMAVMKGQAVPSLQQTSMAAKAMAKALEDPTTATAAFARAGVTLSSSQIAQIKAIAANTNATEAQALSIKGVTAAGAKALSNWSNLTAAQQTAAETSDGLTASQITAAKALGTANAQTAAQQQLMKDLSGYVSGAAAAAADTFSGRLAILKNEMAEELVPAIQKAEKFFIELGAKLLEVGIVLDKHRKLIEEVIGVLAPLAAGILAVVVAMKIWEAATAAVEAVQTALTAVMDMNPIILAIMAVAAVALLVVTHWNTVKQWFDDFMGFLKQHWQAILVVFMPFMAIPLLIIDHWEGVKNFFIGLWDMIKEGFGDVINWIKSNWTLIAAILVAPIGVPLAMWHYFHDQIIALFKDAVSVVESVWNAITGFFSRVISDIINAIKSGVSGFGKLLYDAGKDLIQGLINGIKDSVGDVENAVKSVGKDATDAAKDVLKIFSPSQVFAEIGAQVGAGMVQGIQGAQVAVSNASSQLATSAVTGAQNTPTPAPTATATQSTAPGAAPTNGQQASFIIQGGTYQFTTAQAVSQFFSMNRDGILASKGLSLTQGNVPAGTGATSS